MHESLFAQTTYHITRIWMLIDDWTFLYASEI